MTELVLIGRSSSHFTRTARIFALELGVPHKFQAVLDMTSRDAVTYGGNPTLKVPVLIDAQGPLFGTENICREITERSGARVRVVLRGDVAKRIVANAEELVLHVMSTGVALIMTKIAAPDAPPPPKLMPSLTNALVHLNESIDETLEMLPNDRVLSFFEVAVFAAVTHLSFRQVADVSPYERLEAFRDRFATREGARQTEYRFDAA